jgi:hypothetical protein
MIAAPGRIKGPAADRRSGSPGRIAAARLDRLNLWHYCCCGGFTIRHPGKLVREKL